MTDDHDDLRYQYTTQQHHHSSSQLFDENPALSLLVRAPDIDDNLFEHDDIFDESPYLDPSKSKRNGFSAALDKAYIGVLSFTARQQRHYKLCAVLSIAAIIVATMLVAILAPRRMNDKDLFKGNFPQELDRRLVNLREYGGPNDVPIFWHVPLSGGNILEDVFGGCLKLVQASNVGVFNGHGEEQTLRLVEVYGDTYVNVDTTTLPGIERAKQLDLASSSLADVIFSPFLFEASDLFSKSSGRGRLFTLIRHPIERAVHMYQYLSEAKWDGKYNAQLKDITLEEYASSNYVENNYFTRILTNRTTGALSQDDVDLAKEILDRKCLVGLYSELEQSLLKFEQYFGWRANSNSLDCSRKVLEEWERKYALPMIDEKSDAWRALLAQNWYDMEIYEYAMSLFESQKLAE